MKARFGLITVRSKAFKENEYYTIVCRKRYELEGTTKFPSTKLRNMTNPSPSQVIF